MIDARIIVRKAMKQALSDPPVYGMLPAHIKERIESFIKTDIEAWNESNHDHARYAFHWAAGNL